MIYKLYPTDFYAFYAAIYKLYATNFYAFYVTITITALYAELFTTFYAGL